MSRWKQWVSPPEGALPGGIVTKAGVVLIAVLVGGLLFSWAMTGPQEDAPTLGALPEAQAVDDGMGRSLQARIRQEAERQTLEAAARARAELERRQATAAGEMARLQTESETPNTAAVIPGVSAAESELREALRLEELERRTRSLRALPVAQSYRDPNASAESSEAGTGDAADADVALLENAVQAALASFEQSLGALEGELAAEERLLAALGATAPAPNPGAAAPPSSPRTPATAEPGRSVRPADPPGWERIYEGSFLEGVLLTQLTGDFPGPVLAMVSVPFYSADRQRVLIPRGTRVVGTARGRSGPGPEPARRRVPPVAPARRQLDRPRVHGPEPSGRGRPSGPGRPPLLRHVRGGRSHRRRERARLGRRFAVRPQGGRRPGPRPERDLGSRPVSEPAPHDHDPRGPSPAHLVHLRCPGPQGRDPAITPKELIMRHRTLTTVLLVSILMLASAGPANALFGIGGVIQRAQMIVNQATQIANQIRQMRTMTRQLTELEEQLDYMKEAARGEVDALIEPFSELAAGSIGLVGDDLDWGSDFTGAAGELVDAVRDMGSGSSFTDVWRSAQGVADQVSEADILELFRNRPAEASSRAVEDYRQAKEAADRQRVLDYAMMDAAASLASTVESAQGSFDDLTANGNLSNTALQQAQVAAALTQGRINAAVAQVLAYQAVEQANRMQQAEIDRLERLAEWRDARLRTNAMADAMRTAAFQNRDRLREGLLFKIPSFYMGGQA